MQNSTEFRLARVSIVIALIAAVLFGVYLFSLTGGNIAQAEEPPPPCPGRYIGYPSINLNLYSPSTSHPYDTCVDLGGGRGKCEYKTVSQSDVCTNSVSGCGYFLNQPAPRRCVEETFFEPFVGDRYTTCRYEYPSTTFICPSTCAPSGALCPDGGYNAATGRYTWGPCSNYCSAPPPPPDECVNYSSQPTLYRYPQYNPNRTAVKILQNGLMELGYSLPRFGADGYYGSETANAISQFKSANGLSGGGDVFETSAWDVLDNKLNDARGQSTCNPQPTTYTLRMRSSIYLPGGTSQPITGVQQTTCLGNGTTAFSKDTTTAPGTCSISTPTTITYNGTTYNFVEWYFDVTLQRTGASRTINLSETKNKRTAHAFYRAPSSPARLTVNVSGVSSAPITTTVHTAGYCGNSFNAPTVCESGPTSGGTACVGTVSASYHGIGCADGLILHAGAVAGYTFTGWTGGSWTGSSCDGSGKCINLYPGQTGTVTANYVPEAALAFCGDGITNGSETCDGDLNCTSDCDYAECVDGIDNDGDTLTDESDPGCLSGGDGSYDPDDDSENSETPSLWIDITPAVIGRGGSATARWGAYNSGDFVLDSCSASSNPNDSDWQGAISMSGEKTVTPDQLGTVTYTLTCRNTEGGEGSAQDTVLVPLIREVLP